MTAGNRPSVSKTVRMLQRAGLKIREVQMAPDGGFRVLTDNDNEGGTSADEAWDQYSARKANRAAQGDKAA